MKTKEYFVQAYMELILYIKGKGGKHKIRIFNTIGWESGGVLGDKHKDISNILLIS